MNTTLKTNPNTLGSAAAKPTVDRSGDIQIKAMVYAGPGEIRLQDCPKPVIMAPGDAIVRVTQTTICGTDLHILKGDVPTATPGRILGHEGVGVIDSVGAAVTAFKPGDHVLISCVSACGTCAFCRKHLCRR